MSVVDPLGCLVVFEPAVEGAERTVGEVIGIMNRPAYIVRLADGTKANWPQHMCGLMLSDSVLMTEYWRDRAIAAESRLEQRLNNATG